MSLLNHNRRRRPRGTGTPPAPVPDRLAITTQPSGGVDGVALTQQPVVEVRDASNLTVAQAGIEITVSKASGSGTLGGTLTGTTNGSGRVTFTNLVVTGTGNHTLLFQATGLTSATSSAFDVAAAPGGVVTLDGELYRFGNEPTATYRHIGTAPLKPGQLLPNQLNLVSVWRGGVEQSIAIVPVWGKHPDGSLIGVNLQVEAALAANTYVACQVKLGQVRTTVDLDWQEPVYDPASGLEAGIRNRAVLLLTDPVHLCASYIAKTPLMPQSQDAVAAAYFGIAPTDEFAEWITFLSDENTGSTVSGNEDDFSGNLVVEGDHLTGDTWLLVRNNGPTSIKLIQGRWLILGAVKGTWMSSYHRRYDPTTGTGLPGQVNIAPGGTGSIPIQFGLGQNVANGTTVGKKAQGAPSTATYEYVHGLWCAYLATGDRTMYRYAYERMHYQLCGYVDTSPAYLIPNSTMGATGTGIYSQLTAKDPSLGPGVASGPTPGEQHRGMALGFHLSYLMTGWLHPWRMICLWSSEQQSATTTYTTARSAWMGSGYGNRFNMQRRALAMLVGYVAEATMVVSGSFGGGRSPSRLWATELPWFLQATYDDRYQTAGTGVLEWMDGITGQKHTITGNCGHNPVSTTPGHMTNFSTLVTTRNLMYYYNNIYEQSGATPPTWIRDAVVRLADHAIMQAIWDPAVSRYKMPYCIMDPPVTIVASASYYLGMHKETFAAAYAFTGDPTYLTWATRACTRTEHNGEIPAWKQVGEHWSGHHRSAQVYMNGLGLRHTPGAHPTTITEPPHHPDRPSQLAMSTQPAGAASGVAFTTQPRVQLRDQYGDRIYRSDAGRTVTAAIASGTGVLSGTTTVTCNASGVAVFPNLTITGTGAHTLQFTSTGLTAVTSATVTVS